MIRIFKALSTAALAAFFVWGVVKAAEVDGLSPVDASNTGTAANAGFPENMAPSDVNNAARALEGMLARWHRDVSFMITTGGVANALSATAERTISSYTDGLVMALTVAFANTGGTTLTVDEVGAKNILKHHDQALASGDLEVGQQIVVGYDKGQDAWQLLTPVANAPGDLLASNNLSDLADDPTARTNLGVAYGPHSIWIPAGAMTARTSSPAEEETIETTTNKVNYPVKTFDYSIGDEFAQWSITMPISWDEAGITAAFHWTSINATGVVSWTLRCVGVGNDDAIDVAFGSTASVDDTALAVQDLSVSADTSGLLCANAAEADTLFFEVYRDTDDSADTSLVDAQLLGIRVLYQVNANSDQ